MAILEDHFIGWDPTQGAPPAPACPYIDDGATIVWFEAWTHTGWTAGGKTNTGITYRHSFQVFDALGQALESPKGCNLLRAGFTGNQTSTPRTPAPSPEDWLARARKAVEKYGLPPPGTIQICPPFLERIGARA